MDDTEAPKDPLSPSDNIEKVRHDLDDKEAHKDSVSPSDDMEKSMESFVVPSAKINKKVLQVTLIKIVIRLIALKNLPRHIRWPIYQVLLVN